MKQPLEKGWIAVLQCRNCFKIVNVTDSKLKVGEMLEAFVESGKNGKLATKRILSKE
jgi:hypothetical protein